MQTLCLTLGWFTTPFRGFLRFRHCPTFLWAVLTIAATAHISSPQVRHHQYPRACPMFLLPPSLTRRDGVLILIGASVVYILSSLAYYGSPVPTLIFTKPPPTPQEQPVATSSPSPPSFPSSNAHLDLGISQEIPETSIIAHAPGWTLFQNLYMSNGTLYIVTSNRQLIPEIRMITSTGLIALNTPENIAAREPTEQEMQIIDLKSAMLRWGGNTAEDERHRISSVVGNTVSINSDRKAPANDVFYVGARQ